MTDSDVYTKLFFIASLQLFFILVSCNSTKIHDKNIIARVENAPVTKSEFHYWMMQYKAEIYGYFYHKYKINYTDDFWTTKFDGETPIKRLRKKALKNSVAHKIKQLIAQKLGVKVVFNFDVLMKEREKVNSERKIKKERGEVIYGPVAFNRRMYFQKIRDTIVQQSKDVILKDFLSPNTPPRQRKEFYDKYVSQDNWSATKKNTADNFATHKYADDIYQEIEKKMSKAVNITVNKKTYHKARI